MSISFTVPGPHKDVGWLHFLLCDCKLKLHDNNTKFVYTFKFKVDLCSEVVTIVDKI